MMLCVDKKMLHDSRLDHESGPLPAGAKPVGNGAVEYAADGHAAPLSPMTSTVTRSWCGWSGSVLT
jgi:hypothetical protein